MLKGKQHFHHFSHTVHTEKIQVAFWLNFFFACLEVAGGLWTNSLAVLSDSFHDFGDACALGLAWYFQRLAQRQGDNQFTYGYGRFSLLGALLNVNILIISSVYIIAQSIGRLLHPEHLEAEGMVALAVVGIAVNGVASWYLQKGNSINERVMSLHLLEDVLGWVAILVGSVVIYFSGWLVIDSLLSLGISLYILWNALKNMKAVLTIFLQQVPTNINIVELKTAISTLPQIQELTDFHLWTLSEEQIIASIHIAVQPNTTLKDTIVMKESIREILAAQQILHVTIEIEEQEE
jgi:cobalt-zinc-cadmium efflux system protein